MKALIAALAIFVAGTATAEQCSDEYGFDPRISYIRSVMNIAGGVDMEFIAPRAGIINCLVYGDNNKPLAAGIAQAELGVMHIYDLPMSQIAGMVCRYMD